MFNIGDIVRFTENSLNHGKLAKVFKIVDKVVEGKTKTMYGLEALDSKLKCQDGSEDKYAVISTDEAATKLEFVRSGEEGKVVNMFSAKKRIAKENNDTAGYNYASVMEKNSQKKKKLEEERKNSNKSTKRSYRLD